ncbi:unnamed protein product, partial [Nezara viridula]
MIVRTHTALKKPTKSLAEWKEIITLSQVWFGREFALMAQQSSIFVKKESKQPLKIYQDDILEPVVNPLNDSLFAGSHRVLQQDSAPAHKARSTQQCLQKKMPEFISTSDWPSGSP